MLNFFFFNLFLCAILYWIFFSAIRFLISDYPWFLEKFNGRDQSKRLYLTLSGFVLVFYVEPNRLGCLCTGKILAKNVNQEKVTKTVGPNVFTLAVRREGFGIKYSKEGGCFSILKYYYIIKQLWYSKKTPKTKCFWRISGNSRVSNFLLRVQGKDMVSVA